VDNLDKKEIKDLKYFATDENIERVHVHVGISKKNFQNTYLYNLKGIDKTQMTTALSLGAICMEHHASVDDVLDGMAFVLTRRKLNDDS
jgi:hypothetical protein